MTGTIERETTDLAAPQVAVDAGAVALQQDELAIYEDPVMAFMPPSSVDVDKEADVKLLAEKEFDQLMSRSLARCRARRNGHHRPGEKGGESRWVDPVCPLARHG